MLNHVQKHFLTTFYNRLDNDLIIKQDVFTLLKILGELMEQADTLDNRQAIDGRKDKLIDCVRSFLVDLHFNKKDLSQNLKDLNTMMLFIDGHDYIECGRKPVNE